MQLAVVLLSESGGRVTLVTRVRIAEFETNGKPAITGSEHERQEEHANAHGVSVAPKRAETLRVEKLRSKDSATTMAGIHNRRYFLTSCDPFGIPSTSHWTGAAIIVQ